MSQDLYTEGMCWLRYGKRLPVVCTEVGPWNCDILGLSDKMSVEVEIKKSRSDLLAEFRNKKAKHFAYVNAADTTPFVPNYMYFLVPELMGPSTVETVNANNPKAGVAILTDTNHRDGQNVTVIKKPVRLREAPPRPGFISTAIMRMSSELCHSKLAIEAFRLNLDAQIQHTLKDIVAASFRASGALDMENLEADLEARARELKHCVEGTDVFISDLDRDRWTAAAKQWLDAQYCNGREWTNAAYNYQSRP